MILIVIIIIIVLFLPTAPTVLTTISADPLDCRAYYRDNIKINCPEGEAFCVISMRCKATDRPCLQ
uniref:PlxyGVORF68 protein n=1 Tax=Plutella xylostella granulovirus TaxID=98383 RepID=A0A1B2CSF8_9BBAC|nr:PlxyGVORF68 protein [Plutella xylostella granulovirus]